jgi:hypothetical protein
MMSSDLGRCARAPFLATTQIIVKTLESVGRTPWTRGGIVVGIEVDITIDVEAILEET